MQVLQGVGSFVDAQHLAVETAAGRRVARFVKAIVAAGSQPVKLPFMPDDARIVDSTGALALPFVPGRMLVVGGGIIGLCAGDMIGEIALAIEMGCDAVDISKTIHPHPTLGETIGLAAEVAHGSCTDLPPLRRIKLPLVQRQRIGGKDG